MKKYDAIKWISLIVTSFVSVVALYTEYYNVALVFSFIILTIYEVFYIFNKWEKAELDSEQLKNEDVKHQLDSLKNQVNPHFLFNSLNSLSSLIEEDSEKAKTFIEELAQVYRYLLKSNEHELTTLGKELAFIEAYAFLLKTRFGEGFHLKVDIAEQNKSALIPPLTLQLLVENAVKHNIIAASKPLNVCIFDNNATKSNSEKQEHTNGTSRNNREEKRQFLVVTNNLQQKKAPVASNRLGLKNIIKKYELLGQVDVKVEQTAKAFQVILPLINLTERALVEQDKTKMMILYNL